MQHIAERCTVHITDDNLMYCTLKNVLYYYCVTCQNIDTSCRWDYLNVKLHILANTKLKNKFYHPFWIIKRHTCKWAKSLKLLELYSYFFARKCDSPNFLLGFLQKNSRPTLTLQRILLLHRRPFGQTWDVFSPFLWRKL